MRATVKQIEKDTIQAMKALGTYRPQFNVVISIFSGLVHQYQLAVERFNESGGYFETGTKDGSTKKSGTVTAMENLRKDIVTYSDRLGLNPKALEYFGMKPAKGIGITEMIEQIENSLK